MRKNVYNSVTKTVIDRTTGEISEIETIKKQKITIESEPFYMVFIDYMSPLFQLKNGTAKSVLSYLCAEAQFNTGKVSLSANTRKRICENLGITKTNLSNSLKELVNKKLLAGEKGEYKINPQIFWKGDLKGRNSILSNNEFEIEFRISPASMNCDILPNKSFEE